jgi:hypothetical protein
MVKDNKDVAGQEADEAIKETHGWIDNKQHSDYLGLTQEQRKKLHDKLDSSEGTLQDRLRSHGVLRDKMLAENVAKERAASLSNKAEWLRNYRYGQDSDILKRIDIAEGHGEYNWLSQDQKEELVQILMLDDPHIRGSRAESRQKFDGLLEKMKNAHSQN